MKAILISDKPRWCALMMNGDKNIEVRSSKALATATQKLIDEYGFAEFYVYCSKDGYLYRTNKGYIASKKPLAVGKGTEYTFAYSDEGKVLFKFRCYDVEEIKKDGKNMFSIYYTKCMNYAKLQLRSCLGLAEMYLYFKGKTGYAIHISDLEIFDRPKELSEFSKIEVIDKCNVCPFENQEQNCCVSWKCRITHRLTKAPQNFCYVEVE